MTGNSAQNDNDESCYQGYKLGQKRRRKPVGRHSRERVQKPIAPSTKTGLLSTQGISDKSLQKYFHIFAIIILLGFGSYISITFYGHQVVPNSDFPAFGDTSRALLSFEKPSSFKRTPGLGMLHVLFGYLMPGPHPELTAGWVLNAIFYALIAVLFYLVGRELLGPSAIWYAIIAALNPWSILWMCHPIVEIPLIFFVLLTFYLVMKHSRWSYAAAMMASMIRYEGAAMIMIAFVGDIIHSKSWRPILLASLAAIPLFLTALLELIPPLAALIKIPLLKFHTLYGLKLLLEILIQNIPTLTDVIKIPLLKFQTLYDLKRFVITFPIFGAIVVCLIRYRKGRWAYLPAGIACLFSLLAGLILIIAVFAWDTYQSGLWRKILPKLLFVLLASLPMMFWLYGTKQARPTQGRVVDYSAGYSPNRPMVIDQFSDYAWQLGVSTLFVERVEERPIANHPGVFQPIYHRIRLKGPSQILLCISLVLAISYAIYKKHYNALLLIFFLSAYFLAHATRTGTRPRYAVPLAWLVLLIGCYGLRCGWLILNNQNQSSRRFLAITLACLLILIGWIGFRHIGSPLWVVLLLGLCLALGVWKFFSPHTVVPKPIVIGLSIIVLTVSLLWWFRLFPHLSTIAIFTQYKYYVTYYIPYVGIGVVAVALAIRLITSRAKTIFPDLAASALVCLMITSNQFHLAPGVKTGKMDIEFRNLANWYLDNAKPDEKLVTSMPHVVNIFAPKKKVNFIRTSQVSGRSPSEFVQNCRLTDADYVAWDSRIGIALTNSYYYSWRIDNMREWRLRQEGDHGPFSFVHKIGPVQYYVKRFINIFRLELRQDPEEESPEFTLLSDWYQTNALPNEILLSTRPHILDKMMPETRYFFWHLGGICGETPSRFLEACYRNRIRYVAWDSRLGLKREDPYYKKWGMHRIAMLQRPKSVGPFEFVCQLGEPNGPHINLFRLDLPPAVDPQLRPEFLELALWYRQITKERENPRNYKPPQIILTSIPELMRKYCQNHQNYIWHTGSIRGDSTNEFLINCYRNGVTYIAWDSFNGTNTDAPHYQTWHLERIQKLSQPGDIQIKISKEINVDLKLVKRFEGEDGHYINLFELLRPASTKKK